MARDRDKKPPPGGVSAEDAALFRDAMKSARPLPGHDADKPTAPTASPPAASRPRSRAETPPPTPSSRPARELRPGEAVDVDRRTVERLRRGQLRPEARLDLHGMTADEAHAALADFLRSARSCGKRCVIVITGRGKLGAGKIRAETPHWLNAPTLRPLILAYAEAQPKDGGAGALYVLLRRGRRGGAKG